MRTAFFILFLGIIGGMALAASPPAHAQIIDPEVAAKIQTSAYYINPRYDAMVRTALVHMPKQYDFSRLRALYSGTRQYDPIGEDAIGRLNDLAYKVLHEEDPQKRQRAEIEYQIHVADHLANLGVVLQALALSRQDKRFGEPAFFEWARNGLIQSFTLSRQGKSLQDAFNVITLPEERAIYVALGVKPLSTKAVKEGRRSYTMSKVEDLKTGQVYTVFITTDTPMTFLEKLEKNRDTGPSFYIPRQ